MKSIKVTSLVIVLCALLTACGTSKNVILESTTTSSKFNSVRLIEGDSPVAVEDDDVAYFREKLQENLSEQFATGDGSELTITYRFIGFERGNRAKRYLSGGIGNWGEGGLVIQSVFSDGEGNELSKVNTDATIDSGFFGGDIQSTFKRAANKISEYAVANFAQ